MQRIPRFRLITFLLFLYVAFCGCDPAQSKNVPPGFGPDNFSEIVRHAISNYIDPQSIDVSRSYVGAAEAALKSLPYPLFLMTRSYYEKRHEYRDKDQLMPGKMVTPVPGRGYVVFIPDYQEMNRRNKEEEKKKKPHSSKRFHEAKARMRREHKFQDQTWRQVNFTRKDFEKIISWIEANKEKYGKIPESFKGENIYEKDPFGMHHVYFAGANGFLHAMDPHSGILDRHSWNKMLKESQDSSFEGIGAILRGGGTEDVIVESPLPGSPALAAGLRAGDIILKVDGKSVDALPLSQVVKRIRGKKETIVELFVERPLEERSLAIRIKRGLIVLKAVSSHYLPKERIGVIKISSFLYNTDPPSRMVQQEYEKLLEESKDRLRGLVIDLRNNPGGDLDEAINTTGLFLPRDAVVVRIKGRVNTRDRRNTREPMLPMKGKHSKIPIIVLINAGSASASEIFASALMDQNMALILGDRSFGKASVQGLQSRGEVIIKLTTARYYAPRGYTIQVYGVNPDISVSDEPDNTFPPRFREEDMWRHLPELDIRKPDSGRQTWIRKLKSQVGKNSSAEVYLKKHKNDALKPDYMLQRALAYMRAMRKYPRP